MTADTLIHPITEDIMQIQLPLPFLLRIVNVYLIRDDGGWAVVDTGLHTSEGEAAWRKAFASLAVRPGDLTRIVVTHHHPDHYGMAGWLRSWNEHDVPVHIMTRELAMIQQVWWRDEGQREEFSALSQRAGVGEEMLASFLQISAEIRARTRPHATAVKTLGEGEVIHIGARAFRVIEAPGHSVGQALLYDEADALLLSADHVLMKITPNVGLWPGSDPDPLARFIASLKALRALDVRLALPGHKDLIHNWRGRIDELLHHHEERLGHIRAAAQGSTALQVALAIFPFARFTPHEQRFAVAESLAHLEHLRLGGALGREDNRGVWRYG